MRPTRPSRARTTVLASALLALAVGAPLVATPTTAVADVSSVVPEVAAPAAAAPAVASASGFLYYVYPDPQPLCVSPLGLNASSNPAIDRAACSFARFTVTGATGPVQADLYEDSATTPFVQNLSATQSSTAPGSYTVNLDPTADWPAGAIRMVVREGSTPIGEFRFLHNSLRATVDAGQPSAPGQPFTVSGTVSQVSARTTFDGGEVPAAFTLAITDATGDELYTKAVTAAADGTFTEVVPPAETAGLTEDTVLSVRVLDASYTDTGSLPPTGAWASEVAGAASHSVDVPSNTVSIVNSFVSSVGWVKPGEEYPSTVTVTNDTASAASPTVALTAPTGTSFTSATGPGSHPVSAAGFTWAPGSIPAGESRRLVLTSTAATVGQLDTIVWRDLSSTAVLSQAGQADSTSTSHGPKVIPAGEVYDTARYGDRPFPIVPVQYTDRSYLPHHSGDDLASKINDRDVPGSTFNLFQEMSLGQLYPQGTVPSAGIGSADFAYDQGFEFQETVPGQTCTGTTLADVPTETKGTPLYPERITNGVYNLPGQTQFYGADSNGSAVVGGVAGVGALQAIDSGCGPTGKLVHDAVALADPETDYSDFDTDKDGVVDFFMVVYAGCGGNGASQLGACTESEQDAAPYDNIWPHSSSLEGAYSDPATGLPGLVTDDQLHDLEGKPLWWTDDTFTAKTTEDKGEALKVFVRVGPYNVNPETAIDKASVISHEYGHSLGLPDFYSTGTRETYGDWNLMATDKSQNMDAFSRQEMGWVVPQVLEPGTRRTVTGWQDSKQDIGRITWQKPDGTPYTLTDGQDGIVRNSEMYVAKLPGRTLLDASAFEADPAVAGSVAASKSHLWWSGSGNDFGCPPTGGRNFDLAVPGLSTLPAGTPVELRLKSRWDIEWDYDYGYVLTTTDGGSTYDSHPSNEGYTTSNTDPTAGNPNQNGCQATYDNGLTGTSGSYAADTEAVDRKAGNTPAPVFLDDSYDISRLAGAAEGALRFSYSTDPGLARPGWFIDDVEVVATVDGQEKVLYETDFETSGDPIDPTVYNGGCRKGLATATSCTLGWKYLEAGAASVQDHAYYLEMRDRSGFDFDGKGEIDRDPIGFGAGLSLIYTDEAHGYGNAGTDDPPAQSPLDSVPQPGENAPNLNDAAFTTAAGRSTYSEKPGSAHVDNYADPGSDSGNWEFAYDCLGFTVTKMTGEDAAPAGNLLGDVTFDMGPGCGKFNYGYEPEAGTDNTAPIAAATATPNPAVTGQDVAFSAAGTTDAESPISELDFSWDFDDGSEKVAGQAPTHRFSTAGTYDVTLTVTDPRGGTDTVTVPVTVRSRGGDTTSPTIRTSVSPTPVFINRTSTLSAARSSDDTTAQRDLTYIWDRRNGGRKDDATGPSILLSYKTPGVRTFGLTVTDEAGNVARRSVRVQVYRYVPCNARSVTRAGDFAVLRSGRALRGVYCGTNRSTRGTDAVRSIFRGDRVELVRGLSRRGGTGVVLVDGRRVQQVSFTGRSSLTFGHRTLLRGFGPGKHRIEVRRLRGQAYVEGFLRYQ